MSLKNSRTTCSAMDWPTFLYLVDCLKKEENYRLLLYCSLSVYLGLRSSDVRYLKWKEIWKKEFIDIKERKTKKGRTIHINKNLKEVIELVGKIKSADKKLNEYVFANREGNPISIQYWNRCLAFNFSKFNIEVDNPSTHTLRKTFGLRCFEAQKKLGLGENALVFLSEVFNHQSPAVTRRYLGISKEQVKNLYLSL